MACKSHTVLLSSLRSLTSLLVRETKKGTILSYTCLGDPLIVVIGRLVKFIVRKRLKALIIVP